MIPCATCGAEPIGIFDRDGSPRYAASCDHPPLKPEEAHPAYRELVGLLIPTSGTLEASELKRLEPVVKRVTERYEKGKVAHMKYRAAGRSIESVVRDGLGAELFVARWTGLEWNRGNARKPDVGDDVEVRNVGRPDAMLSLYGYDTGSRRFILSVGRCPNYRLVGWIPGRAGMTAAYWHLKGEAIMGYQLDVSRWLVPQADLRPMYEFEKEIADAAALPEAEAQAEAV